jgi:hypothetical protein
MQPGSGITARWPFGAVLPVGAAAPSGGAISVIQAPPYPYTGTFGVEGQEEAAQAEMEANAQARAEMLEKGPQADEVEEEETETARTRRSGRSRGNE